ncbi:pre-mRNA 3-end-processing factor fip1l1 [Geranomyces variabilis]|nr:pre-mRNA 3-end-processing factor fip1l1 [Geranomyces variabilis]
MEDDEKFLYGAPIARVEDKAPASAPDTTVEEDLDDAPYEPPEDDIVYDTPSASTAPAASAPPVNAGTAAYQLDDEDEEEEEDSDDDIQIILDMEPSAANDSQSHQPHQQQQQQHHVLQPQAPQPQQISSVQKTETVKPSPITRTQAKIVSPMPRQDGTVPPPVKPPVIQKATVDVDEVGQFDGIELCNLDLDTLEEKPWRRPGADISDFFNYGFNEQTWKLYCEKQKRAREDFPPDAGLKEIAAVGFTPDGVPFHMQPYPGMPRTAPYEMRPAKRPREDDDEQDPLRSDDARERPMPGPRFFPEDFNPEFGAPPPMGMFPEGPYGHMPPPGFGMVPPPGFDPYRQQQMRGAPPVRPNQRGGLPPPPQRGSARGDRPYYPGEMEGRMEPPSAFRPQFSRPGYESRGPGYGRDTRRPGSPRSDRD